MLALGTRFSDRVTDRCFPGGRHRGRLVHVDCDPSSIDKNVHVDLGIVADVKDLLTTVDSRVKPRRRESWLARIDGWKSEERPAERASRKGAIAPRDVVEAVARCAGEDAIVVADVGQNQMFATRYFTYHQPRSIVTSGGLGTMGFGLPAAVGATFGRSDRTVCLFMGDGGFQMSIQELGTIMEQKAPVKMILLNNNYLGNVRQWQDMFFGGRKSFTRMMNPDYAQIVSGYGIPYAVCVDRADLAAKIGEMLATDGPFLLECAVREEDNVLPMTSPGKSVDEMQLTI